MSGSEDRAIKQINTRTSKQYAHFGLEMTLNDLFRGNEIDPQKVIAFRHRPWEPQLNKVLPWLAADRPDLFNAYQQSQTKPVERAMDVLRGTGYVAAFIRYAPGKALFIGLYSIRGAKRITRDQYWSMPANVELKSFGMSGFTDESKSARCLWFDLAPIDFYCQWKGKLIVGWPPPERSWWRRAHRPQNEMSIISVLEDSALDAAMPAWDEIDLTWRELSVLPSAWKSTLRQWRGVYFIFDTSDGKGYVGSAYGEDNLLGRWENYAARGHGGNRLLRQRDPRNFRFTILQIVAHDMQPSNVIRLEASWKRRLHTRQPFGLNEN